MDMINNINVKVKGRKVYDIFFKPTKSWGVRFMRYAFGLSLIYAIVSVASSVAPWF